MDAAQALADLTEISSQIEGAVLAAADGDVIASTFDGDEDAARIAEDAKAMLAAADSAGARGQLSHVRASTPDGCVFVVRDGERVVAAITGPEPTAGLVFYDLKACLRLAVEDGAEKPKASRTRKPRATKARKEATDA